MGGKVENCIHQEGAGSGHLGPNNIITSFY